MAEKFNIFSSQAPTIIKAVDWCQVQQASPGTAFPKPSKVAAFSNGIGTYPAINYDGSSNAIKTLIMFAAALPAPQTVAFNFSKQNDGVAAVSALGFFASTSMAQNIVGVLGVRIRPILAPYSLTGLTWNGFNASPPSLGSPFGQAANFANQSDVTGSNGNSLYNTSMPVRAVYIDNAQGSVIYGFVIDAGANALMGTFTTHAPTSLSTTLNADIPTFQTGIVAGSPFPYIVVMTP